mmetsp:Transcript_2357/g.3313  ORF Transcript_2357/g.3313 Transcript_2357/m.3313 type:complete len:586 (-) Transcript_2357:46-1803(-)
MNFLLDRQISGDNFIRLPVNSANLKRKCLFQPFSYIEDCVQNGYRYLTNSSGHFACINALSLSRDPRQTWVASGGDDQQLLVWHTDGFPSSLPVAKFRGHMANIFCATFDQNSKAILSGGNDFLIIRHDLEAQRESVQMFHGHEGAVHRISYLAGDDNVFLSASDDGSIRLWDVRVDGTQARYDSPKSFTAVDCHPHLQHLFISGNSGFGVKLWDLRAVVAANSDNGQIQARCLLRYDLSQVDVVDPILHGDRRPDMGVCGVNFNEAGTQAVVSIRHHYPTVLPVDLQTTTPVAQLQAKTYRNSTTLKSCCFVGERDECVASGSDDGGVFLWKLPFQAGKSPGPTGAIPYKRFKAAPLSEPATLKKQVLVTPSEEESSDESDAAGDENSKRIKFRQVQRWRSRAARSWLSFSTSTSVTEKPVPCKVKEPFQILRGHRSIPNHIVWHRRSGLLLSCGVEKTIKVWSFHPIDEKSDLLTKTSDNDIEWSADSYCPVMLTATEAQQRLLDLLRNEEEDATANTTVESEHTIALFDYLSRRETLVTEDTPLAHGSDDGNNNDTQEQLENGAAENQSVTEDEEIHSENSK